MITTAAADVLGDRTPEQAQVAQFLDDAPVDLLAAVPLRGERQDLAVDEVSGEIPDRLDLVVRRVGVVDAAEVAVAHLLAPRPASTQISYPPPAEIITHAELARIISAETGRAVRYEHISAASWRQELEIDAAANPGSAVNIAMAQHISTIGAALSQRSEPLVAPDPQALAGMLNRPPTPFIDFVRQNLHRFSAATARV